MSTTPELLKAPFTEDQVESINAYQLSGVFHEFTCGRRDQHPGQDDMLVATAVGLHCQSCDYTQDWVHSWMADWSWEPRWQELKSVFREPGS